jgi:hypothetical protein
LQQRLHEGRWLRRPGVRRSRSDLCRPRPGVRHGAGLRCQGRLRQWLRLQERLWQELLRPRLPLGPHLRLQQVLPEPLLDRSLPSRLQSWLRLQQGLQQRLCEGRRLCGSRLCGSRPDLRRPGSGLRRRAGLRCEGCLRLRQRLQSGLRLRTQLLPRSHLCLPQVLPRRLLDRLQQGLRL